MSRKSKLKHLPSYTPKVKIFHSSGLSVSFMRYFCAETHTHTRISSFFLLVSLIHLLHSLWCIFSVSFSHNSLIHLAPFTPARCSTQTVPTLLCLHLYSFITYILSEYGHYFDVPVVSLDCDFHSDFFSYQTDSNIAGFMSLYAITVRSGVFATVGFKVTAC